MLNWNRIGLHILFWAVYLPLNALLSNALFGYNGPFEAAFGRALVAEGFSLPVKIGLTYFVFYRIVPLYLERSKWWRMLAILLLAFSVSILAYRAVMVYAYRPMFGRIDETAFWEARYFLLTAFDCFITLAAACSIKFVRMQYESVEIEKQLIREKLESELGFLRAQTNPHFLFNTLNNIYALARKKSDQTPDAVMMLSKIMRFVLYECREARVPIESEARVIGDYIALEQLRYSARLRVQYDQNIDEPGCLVAPLMLLPFVENSFKHGAGASTGPAAIEIELNLRQRSLNFSVKNTVEPDAPPAPSGGIGIANVRRQLDLLYNGRHRLEIEQKEHFFSVLLYIDLS
ncbi:MAG: histidine kinase [Bacteroidetes bacterium]|nr:histidine kinase [Bacteroidota bacterium]